MREDFHPTKARSDGGLLFFVIPYFFLAISPFIV